MRTSAFIAAFIALVLQTGAALAHAALVSSDPADGAVLATAPSRVVLTFDEPVSPMMLRLIGDKGEARPLTYRLADAAVIVDNPGPIGGGSHALSWRVISADGHPVGGRCFSRSGRPARASSPAPR